MTQRNKKNIGERHVNKQADRMDVLRDTWTIMKPLVHFSIKAMKVLAHALIFIVKNIPKPEGHKSEEKKNSGKVVKI